MLVAVMGFILYEGVRLLERHFLKWKVAT